MIRHNCDMIDSSFARILSARTAIGHDKDGRLMLLQVKYVYVPILVYDSRSCMRFLVATVALFTVLISVVS